MLPLESIRIRSVGEDAPSAVVPNKRRPGISVVPGVPSTSALIVAAVIKFVPSAPLNAIIPRASPLVTTVIVPSVVPRLRLKSIIP